MTRVTVWVGTGMACAVFQVRDRYRLGHLSVVPGASALGLLNVQSGLCKSWTVWSASSIADRQRRPLERWYSDGNPGSWVRRQSHYVPKLAGMEYLMRLA